MPTPLGIYALGPISLPNPAFPKGTLRVVENAIAEAWRIIREEPQGGFRLDKADEDRITLELRSCLMDRVLDGGNVEGFTSDLFQVTREAKFPSFDGTHLDKMPDLHIAVIRDCAPGLHSADGLFVECKPVDRGHPAGRDYCDKGVLRFVIGEYAWAMPQGMMIGYAATGYRIPKKLQEALASRQAALNLEGDVMACPDCSGESYLQHPHITIHRRGFTYPRTGTKAPEITIRHLWFNRG